MLQDARDAFRLSLNRFLCPPRDLALVPSARYVFGELVELEMPKKNIKFLEQN
jgi:hypothetical protein